MISLEDFKNLKKGDVIKLIPFLHIPFNYVELEKYWDNNFLPQKYDHFILSRDATFTSEQWDVFSPNYINTEKVNSKSCVNSCLYINFSSSFTIKEIDIVDKTFITYEIPIKISYIDIDKIEDEWTPPIYYSSQENINTDIDVDKIVDLVLRVNIGTDEKNTFMPLQVFQKLALKKRNKVIKDVYVSELKKKIHVGSKVQLISYEKALELGIYLNLYNKIKCGTQVTVKRIIELDGASPEFFFSDTELCGTIFSWQMIDKVIDD